MPIKTVFFFFKKNAQLFSWRETCERTDAPSFWQLFQDDVSSSAKQIAWALQRDVTDQPNPADNISDRPLAGVFLLLCFGAIACLLYMALMRFEKDSNLFLKNQAFIVILFCTHLWSNSILENSRKWRHSQVLKSSREEGAWGPRNSGRRRSVISGWIVQGSLPR